MLSKFVRKKKPAAQQLAELNVYMAGRNMYDLVSSMKITKAQEVQPCDIYTGILKDSQITFTTRKDATRR